MLMAPFFRPCSFVLRGPQLQECQVVQVLPPRPSKLNRPPHMTLQIGAYDLKQYIVDPEVRQRLGMAPTRKKKEYKETVQMIGHFKKHDVTPKKVLQEFKVSDDAVLPVGAYSPFGFLLRLSRLATAAGKDTALTLSPFLPPPAIQAPRSRSPTTFPVNTSTSRLPA